MERKTFGPGTVIRCNRCDRKSIMNRTFEATRENGKAWRIENMLTAQCGHMDSHWVYDQDNEQKEAR